MAGTREKQLNAIVYYGGKGRMFQEIIDRLDYDNTRVYLEIFGGGASVLLNKARHDIEVYNEQNLGVYTLFKVLSDYEKGMELRERLKMVDYKREVFWDALAYKNGIEDKDIAKENMRKLNRFIQDIEQKHNMNLFLEYRKYYKENNEPDKVIEEVLKKISLTEKEKNDASELLKEYQYIVDGTFVAESQGNYDEIDVAMATFIVHNMSMNGMGRSFSGSDNKEKSFFYKVEDLIDVIERLQGVIILNMDARVLLERDCLNKILQENGVDAGQITDRQLMYYLDPPYLEDERVALEKEKRGKKSGIPGLLYKNGDFNVTCHRMLLCQLLNKQANILVSNYRDKQHLYDTYLNEQAGWEHIEYEAVTSFGGSCGERTEVLWQNY